MTQSFNPQSNRRIINAVRDSERRQVLHKDAVAQGDYSAINGFYAVITGVHDTYSPIRYSWARLECNVSGDFTERPLWEKGGYLYTGLESYYAIRLDDCPLDVGEKVFIRASVEQSYFVVIGDSPRIKVAVADLSCGETGECFDWSSITSVTNLALGFGLALQEQSSGCDCQAIIQVDPEYLTAIRTRCPLDWSQSGTGCDQVTTIFLQSGWLQAGSGITIADVSNGCVKKISATGGGGASFKGKEFRAYSTDQSQGCSNQNFDYEWPDIGVYEHPQAYISSDKLYVSTAGYYFYALTCRIDVGSGDSALSDNTHFRTGIGTASTTKFSYASIWIPAGDIRWYSSADSVDIVCSGLLEITDPTKAIITYMHRHGDMTQPLDFTWNLFLSELLY